MPTVLKERDLKRKNFKAHEFLKSDTADKLGIDNTPNQDQFTCGIKIADKAQEIRDAVNIPMIITSGFRCPQLNKAVRGSSRSKHMKFLAIDFVFKNLTPEEGVLKIKESGVSVDKCFIEHSCIHVQICEDSSKNRNFFGTAKRVGSEWVVKPLKK